MGAASYLEDIIDRRGDFSVRERTSLPAGMFLATRPMEAGWVRLAHKDGVPFADRFVPVVGETVRAGVSRENPNLDWKLEVEPRENQSVPADQCEPLALALVFTEPGLYLVRLVCGAYCKVYEVEVLSKPEIDTLPRFKDAYERLIGEHEQWTENSIHRHLEALRQPNGDKAVPRSFSDGLFEYHLALYLADRDMVRSHQCFAEAYRRLRPFAGLSAIAMFVVDYILFRKNNFDGHGESSQTRFGGLRRFFRIGFDEWLPEAQGNDLPPRGEQVRVLLLPTDQLCLRILQAIRDDDRGRAKSLLRELEGCKPVDIAELARVALVLARGYCFIGKRSDARRHYAHLNQISGVPLWSQEAENFLR